jgi:PAS domain S-box-containing protein
VGTPFQAEDKFKRRIMEEMMREENPNIPSKLNIFTTSSPIEALELLNSHTFDCIISDYQMPKMVGIELCTNIRKTLRTPFILYTGHGSEEVAASAFAAGIDYYFRKERELSHLQVLAKTVRTVVEKRRAEELYKACVEDIGDGLCIVQGLNIVFANHAMAEMLGLRDKDALIGSSIMRWIVAMERGIFDERELRTTYEPKLYKYKIMRADGKVRTISASVSLINYLGKPASLVFNHDVTE